jgi:hypothetical protein
MIQPDLIFAGTLALGVSIQILLIIAVALMFKKKFRTMGQFMVIALLMALYITALMAYDMHFQELPKSEVLYTLPVTVLLFAGVQVALQLKILGIRSLYELHDRTFAILCARTALGLFALQLLVGSFADAIKEYPFLAGFLIALSVPMYIYKKRLKDSEKRQKG